GLQVGQTLEMVNGDDTAHNIANLAKKNSRFNISQPQKGMINKQTFTQPEIMVKLTCNVHGWMEAWCGVLAHPFFAVSGDDGSFNIDRIPPGEYTIEAWHELWGTLTQKVQLKDGEMIDLKLTFMKKAT